MGNRAFWTGKRVFLTGHTGFKGSWLMLWLQELGAEVHGMALPPDTVPALFNQLLLEQNSGHFIGDIRNPGLVHKRLDEVAPDIVLHLAAQPLVLYGYREPVETWTSNVMGTVHLLDALRGYKKNVAVVCITTDKVYENQEWAYGYRENDRLGGYDPYSASKAACELVIDSYRRSFFTGGPVRIASARAGNVIGGGDWAENRIFPDIIRALTNNRKVEVRNPNSIRPWQHVLDPLMGYLCLAEALWHDESVAKAFNFGPNVSNQKPVKRLVESTLAHWPGTWHDTSNPNAMHEAGQLALSIDSARNMLGWQPCWDFDLAVEKTVEWYRAVDMGTDPRAVTMSQIGEFERDMR